MDNKVNASEGLIKELNELQKDYDLLNTSYSNEIVGRKHVEHALEKSEHNLKERIKELNGIYSLGRLAEEINRLEDIYRVFVNNVVPESMQFPEKVFVSLEIDKKKYCNIENFKLSERRKYLSAPIKIFSKNAGELIVAYTEDLPIIDFFEQNLINNYAERISKISERIKTQQNLEKSEIEYRNLVDNIGEGIGIVNVNEVFLFANSGAERIFGVGKGELPGMNLKEFLSEEHYINILSQTKIREKNQSSSYETELTLRNGEKRNILITAVPQFNDNEVFIGTYGIFRDITERKKVEKELKESESSLRESQKLAKMGSWTLNIIDQTTEWSENCFTIYGYKPFEFSPTFEHFKNRVHPDDWIIVEKNMDFVFKNKVNCISEMRIILPDGTIKWFQNNVVPILQDDKIIKLIGVNLDITESKLAELVLKENRNKLLQLNKDKDRFISILGHDLKTPFNNILGLSEELIDNIHNFNKSQVENIANDINKTARTIYKLLEDILLWARTQQGKIQFKPQILNFWDTYKNVLEVLKPNADAKNIEINYSDSNKIDVFADIDMLKIVLRNLISNSIKFTNNGGAININVEQTNSKVTISVSDNGIGIPPDDLTKLFDIREVITTKGTENETGTGLGLLLCKDFVEMHGGKIWVESEEGKGSDFKITLPRNVEPNDLYVVSNVIASDDIDSNISKLKILITDDDVASRKFLGITLKTLGKEILYANNGFEAVVLCKEKPDIDLILMDIKMPEMDGFEATRQIRQTNKEVIIIIQSAFIDSAEREKAKEAGCNDFISKPINKTFLKELIKKNCEK